MATETQTKLVGFCLGDKSNYSATTYANHIWFDPTNKQILLNGIEYIPKKLSELVNDKNFITSITKSMVEGVLTGNITSHTHSYLSLSGGTISTTGSTTLNIKSGSSKMDSVLRFTDNDTSEIYEILLRRPSSIYGLQYRINDNYYNLLHSGNYNSYALPLTGGTLSGALTCNGDYINMNNDSGSRGYRGFFNQSGTSNRASGSHIFMGNGQALGSNAISLGYNAFAGIRNQDADKGTYPYIAWQWMPTEKIHITINNQDTANGEFYGYEVLGGKMVQYELGGNTYTYENTSTTVRVLVCVKDDADTGLIFGGKSYMPFNATKTLIQGKYILGRGESITAVNTITVGEVNYYVLAIYTWSATIGYDYSTQVKVMCATKVNNSNYNGASSYASGYYSVASGAYSVASGAYSVASGISSVASGYSSVASGYYSVASGYSSVASGYYSVASGYYSVASHDFSVVLARNGETQSSYQTIIGRYNAKVAGLFIIGNGTSDTARSNALVVDESGNVTAKYFSGYANAVGSEGIKVYATNSNEINFGGISSSTTIYFGFRSMDSRPTPTIYDFGRGNAIIQAASFTGNAATATKSEYSRNLLGRNTSGSDYPVISGNLVFAEWNTMSDNRWYLKADGYECRVAYATSATKLGASSVGSATQPIYFSNGKPVACSYTLGKSVPSNAVFTDTTYSVATASADGLMSSAMFNTEKVSSISVRQGAAAYEEIVRNHDIYVTYNKDNALNSAEHIAGGDVQIKIPNATKDYDGSMSYTDKRKLDGISPYAPKKVVMLQVTFNSNGTATTNKGGGDYDITKDADIMGSEYVEETSANGHYVINLSFDTATSSNPLINWFNNYFVKFGFMSKSTDGSSDFFINLNSAFDGDTLYIQCISTKTKYTDTFDCIWEFY